MSFHYKLFSVNLSIRAVRSGLMGQLAAVMGALCLAGCATPAVVKPIPSRAESEAASLSVEELLAAADQAADEEQYPKVARLLVRAAQRSDDEAVVGDAAQGCYQNHQLQAALEIAQRWLVINPTNLEARELAALSAIKLYQVDIAAKHLQVLLEQAYITPAAGFMEWLNKIPASDANAALVVMKKLASTHAQMAEAHYAVARFAELTEDVGLMLTYAQRAHDLSPYWAPAGLLLAKGQLLRGQPDLALQTAQDVVKNDDSLGTRSEYAALLLAAGKPNEAVQLWRELEQTEGDNSAAVRSLAYLDIQVGNYQSAFNRLNVLLNAGNKVSESIFYLAGIAERTGATAEARQLYGRVQDGAFALPAQLRIANLIKDSEGLDSALNSLQSFGQTNPEEVLQALQARAQMLSVAGDDVAALSLYDQGVADYPDVASLRITRAFHLLKMNKVSLGIQAMRDVLQVRPEDPTVLNALGYTLLDHTKQHQEGYEYIKRAFQSTPDSAAVMDSMGWALFKLGRQQEALLYLQQAADKMRDEEVELHLGEVLWSLDRRDEAVRVWQEALKLAPDNKVLQERLKRAPVSR